MTSRDLGRSWSLSPVGALQVCGVFSRPAGFVLLVLAHGLQGERLVGYFKTEVDLTAWRDKTRGPVQVGGYASMEDPVLVDIVARFKAGEALPIRRRTAQ